MNQIKKIFNLKNKVAVITGGAGTLGSQYGQTLASAGAQIVLLDIDAKCQKLASQLQKKYGRKMLGIEADISKKEEIKTAFKQIEKTFDKIDILINNAAFNCPASDKENYFHPFHDYPLELWQKSVAVNLTGAFLCSQETIRLMLKKKTKGSIINIASTYGLVAPDQRIYNSIRSVKDKTKQFIKPADYSATKSAVLNFTRYLAAAYGPFGIRVNTLTPGGVYAESMDKKFVEEYKKRTPLNRMARPDDYNGAILFLASDASIYMTGANLIIDGGWTAW